jgi:hypothetical protein
MTCPAGPLTCNLGQVTRDPSPVIDRSRKVFVNWSPVLRHSKQDNRNAGPVGGTPGPHIGNSGRNLLRLARPFAGALRPPGKVEDLE